MVESLGDRFVDPGNPLKSWTVSQHGATEGWTDGTPVAGYGSFVPAVTLRRAKWPLAVPISVGTANIQVAKIYVLE